MSLACALSLMKALRKEARAGCFFQFIVGVHRHTPHPTFPPLAQSNHGIHFGQSARTGLAEDRPRLDPGGGAGPTPQTQSSNTLGFGIFLLDPLAHQLAACSAGLWLAGWAVSGTKIPCFRPPGSDGPAAETSVAGSASRCIVT